MNLEIDIQKRISKISTESELRDKFDSQEYNILIVAEKYQTGYDQPLLHTMYVDKKLYGIKAVQTLSRLNRIHIGKTDTFIIDFQNTIEEVIKAFEPFYQGTTLVDKTDPSYLFRLYDLILKYGVITNNDLNEFAETYFKPRSSQFISDLGKLYSIMDPVLDRFRNITEIQQDGFKQRIKEFIETYSFMAQIVSYDYTNLEKLFVFVKFIATKNLLKEMSIQIPELNGDVSLEWYRLEKTYVGRLPVDEVQRPLVARDNVGRVITPEVLTTLSEIISKFNERFGIDVPITEADKLVVETWLKNLESDAELREYAQANEFSDFLRIYETRLENQMLSSLSDNLYLVEKIFADTDLKKKIMVTAAEFYYKWAKTSDLPPVTPETPSQNRLLFRQAIRSCAGHIYWIDLFLGQEGLEFLMDSFNHQSVKEIKILTSLYNNENQISEELRKRFTQFQKEMEQKGVSLEMRLVSTKVAYDNLPHDRFIIGQNIKYNVPSFTTIIKGRFSEIKKTTNDIPFINYWNNIDSLDLIKDWPKIRDILDKTRRIYEVNCSSCGKITQVMFKPDYRRPVYCKQCLGRR
jgi:CxxC-x17-CxxC domain-containing protein